MIHLYSFNYFNYTSVWTYYIVSHMLNPPPSCQWQVEKITLSTMHVHILWSMPPSCYENQYSTGVDRSLHTFQSWQCIFAF